MSDKPSSRPASVPADFPLPRGHVVLIGTGAISVSLLPTWAIGLRTWYGLSVRACLTYTATCLVSSDAVALATQHPVTGPQLSLSQGVVPHRELCEWADLMIVAPATVNFVAKCALGIADSLALTVVQNATCPVVIAPSVPAAVTGKRALARNLATLAEDGYVVVPTKTGVSVHSGSSSDGAPADIATVLHTARAALADAVEADA